MICQTPSIFYFTLQLGFIFCSGNYQESDNLRSVFPSQQLHCYFYKHVPPYSLVPGGWLSGYCLDSSGRDQNKGAIQLPAIKSLDQCLAACRKHVGATGCELHHGGFKRCTIHTADVASGKGNHQDSCWVFSSGSTPTIPSKPGGLFTAYFYKLNLIGLAAP